MGDSIIDNKRLLTLVKYYIFPLVLIPLIFFGAYFTYMKIDSYQDSRDKIATGMLNGMSAVFQSYNDSVSEILTTYSQLDVFKKERLNDLDRILINDLIIEYSKSSSLQDIAFGTANGEMFTPHAAALPAEYDPRYRPWYMEASRVGGTIVISSPYRDARDPSVWSLSYAVQVVSEEGVPTGVLGTDLKLKGIEAYFNNYFNNFDGRIIILDKNSNIILEKEEGRFALSNKQGIAFEFIQSDGVNIDILYENQEYRMDKTRIDKMGWSVVLLTPKVEIINEIIILILPLLLVFVISLLMINRLFAVVKRSLLYPLERFSEQLDEVGLGEYPNEVFLNYAIPKELHVIRAAVNRMIARIHRQTSTLQEQKEEISGQYEEINALYEETTAMNESLNDLVDEIQENYKRTIYSLSSAIEANDAYTKGHCDRVKEFVLKLGLALELNESDLKTLETAAILHDIGKVGVPSEILNKPTLLTEEEYMVVKGHPAIGAQILKDIPYLRTVAKIIEQHHEWVDGNGYPFGLIEQEIHPYAQILCIADAFDAMTSQRPYRKKALSLEEAIVELKRSSGTQFSQRKVDLFIETLQNEKNQSIELTK